MLSYRLTTMKSRPHDPVYDVVIAGGGPGGLAAALAFGRARKRVLLGDAGPRRNAAAVHIQTFVTRDGTPPDEFRRIAREQLRAYPSVTVRDAEVTKITGQKDAFTVAIGGETVTARRVLLCTGMVDVLPDLEGLRDVWGTSAFQCPYCHGWEVQDRRFGYLPASPEAIDFALLLRGWTSDVAVITDGRFDLTPDVRARLGAAGIRVDDRRVVGLTATAGHLERIEFDAGDPLERDVLFVHPPQRQVEFVQRLCLAADAQQYLVVDDATQETSMPGIYAAGDCITRAQAALLAAASGMRAAAAMNHELTAEMAVAGMLV
jgi:thioredoxin reductase